MKILLAEDDPALGLGLAETMRRAGEDVVLVSDGRLALDALAGVELLITDLRLPGLSGLELLIEAREKNPKLEAIVMTAYGTIPSAVEAMRRGARTYLAKPFDPEELLLQVREVGAMLELRRAALRAGRGQLAGSSAVMSRVYGEIDTAAGSDAPLLISGETGTGKELAARAVHDLSRRRREPFVAVNLGALPRDLVESELFGYEKGAFTGATGRRRGRFQLAGAGTIFLDEIDSLPVEIQPKLLRALENREAWPLGAEHAEKISARIIAASNADLARALTAGRFREDLYYRLNVLQLELPPLRRHVEDIPQLVRVLLERSATGKQFRAIAVAPAALAALMLLPWPGNVRELGNVLERALVRAAAGKTDEGTILIECEHLDAGKIPAQPALPFRKAKIKAADEWSRQTIRLALAHTRGNVSHAAKHMQISRTALIRLMHRYQIK